MSFYCLKAYKGEGGAWKSPNLSVQTLWMVTYLSSILILAKLINEKFYANKKKVWHSLFDSPVLLTKFGLSVSSAV